MINPFEKLEDIPLTPPDFSVIPPDFSVIPDPDDLNIIPNTDIPIPSFLTPLTDEQLEFLEDIVPDSTYRPMDKNDTPSLTDDGDGFNYIRQVVEIPVENPVKDENILL